MPRSRVVEAKGVAVLVWQTCLQGRVKVRDRWVGGELFGVHWQRKENRSMAGKEGHIPQDEKNKSHWGIERRVGANQGGYEKGGVDGNIGARAPANRGWEGRPWLCRRRRLKGRWWFGSG